MFLSKKRAVGISVSDRWLEVVSVERQRGRYVLRSANRVSLPAGAVTQGRCTDDRQFQLALKQALASAQPSPIPLQNSMVALSDANTYVHLFRATRAPTRELDAAVWEEARRVVPLGTDDLGLTWRETDREHDSVGVLSIGVSLSATEAWRRCYASLGVRLEQFALEPYALFRGLGLTSDHEPLAVVDVQGDMVTVSVSRGDQLQYSLTMHMQEGGTDDARASRVSSAIQFAASHGLSIARVVCVGTASPDFVAAVGKASGFSTTVGEPVLSFAVAGHSPAVFIKAIGLAFLRLHHFDDPMIPAFRMQLAPSTGAQNAPSIIATLMAELKGTVKRGRLNKTSSEHPSTARERIRWQLIILACVLFFGGVLLSLAFWYRAQQESMQAVPLGVQDEFQVEEVMLDVVFDPSSYRSSVVRARRLEVVQPSADPQSLSTDEDARRVAEEQLQPGETVAAEPLSIGEDRAGLVQWTWVAYSQDDVNRLSLEKIKEKRGNEQFFFSEAEIVTLESSSDGTTASATTRVRLSQ